MLGFITDAGRARFIAVPHPIARELISRGATALQLLLSFPDSFLFFASALTTNEVETPAQHN
jgi:hypothetical protein